MVLLLNAADFECSVVKLPLPTKNYSRQAVIIMQLDCSIEDGQKNVWIQPMLSKNNDTLGNKSEGAAFATAAPTDVSISIPWTLPLFRGCVYIARKNMSCKWENAHISKQAFYWEPSVVITGEPIYLHATAVLSHID